MPYGDDKALWKRNVFGRCQDYAITHIKCYRCRISISHARGKTLEALIRRYISRCCIIKSLMICWRTKKGSDLFFTNNIIRHLSKSFFDSWMFLYFKPSEDSDSFMELSNEPLYINHLYKLSEFRQIFHVSNLGFEFQGENAAFFLRTRVRLSKFVIFTGTDWCFHVLISLWSDKRLDGFLSKTIFLSETSWTPKKRKYAQWSYRRLL